MSVFAQQDDLSVNLTTEPGLTVAGTWVCQLPPPRRSVVRLVVGAEYDRLKYRLYDEDRLDLEMREEGFLTDSLKVLVLTNRPALGMWVWDTLSAAYWLRQQGYREVELVGAGPSGSVIATCAALLSDDIDTVSLVGDTIPSLETAVVNKQLRHTPYWCYRLLWLIDLPQARDWLRDLQKMR